MRKKLVPALALLVLASTCTAQEPPRQPPAPAPSTSSQTVDPRTGLTAEVAAVRAGILDAARHSDYEMLRPLLRPEVFLSDFGFGADPIARWASRGERPLRIMAALLGMGHVEEESNEELLFRWPPYDAETRSLDDMSARDRRAFRSVMTPRELGRLVPDEELGYVGPRLGILADGTWWFFLLDPGP